MSDKMKMVDLFGQYGKIKKEINSGIQNVIDTSAFIHGPEVSQFENNLAQYLNAKHVISCANGTDALQIALMALDLKRGDEVIVPAFTYVSTAEVIGLLGLVPVMVDVCHDTFNIATDNVSLENIEKALTKKTKAIVPVHLFGQSCDMKPLMEFAKANKLFVIEDNAQALGAKYFPRGKGGKNRKKPVGSFTGTIGDIGCTSFFPTKNLGCFGDGGALITNNNALAERIRMIANHGQVVKYHHKIIGCNSRLDTLQAAVLDVKLKYLNAYLSARYNAAQYYTSNLKSLDPGGDFFETPYEMGNSTHTYHQYTLKVKNIGGKNSTRDALRQFLANKGVPSMIYYPLPLQEQEAFKNIARIGTPLDESKKLAYSVLSLPMHTELTHKEQDKVIRAIKEFYSL
ncbi:MAG: DegT/DnrJ/EryC1/StrS family aminotransferase [Bacteroidales bacterium]|jgi:UDP-2-acetamido-2-deoxy-ribo-hexuluronate aminotransferase|nr:DegT/DnrJ/EryC1/StrS family aminotransferase [Bacteroidales bacterium]MCI1732794.1 DegT/DnrJ/EryC1/StrS family aminotransferase [Bacteroidales bacterium]